MLLPNRSTDVALWLFFLFRIVVPEESVMQFYFSMSTKKCVLCTDIWRTEHSSDIYENYNYYRETTKIGVTLLGGMADWRNGMAEYSKRRNILKDGIYRILCILLELTKKQRQRMLGCFGILKIQFSYCRLLWTLWRFWKPSWQVKGLVRESNVE